MEQKLNSRVRVTSGRYLVWFRQDLIREEVQAHWRGPHGQIAKNIKAMHEYVQQYRFTDFLIEYEGSRAGVKTLVFAHIIPPMSPKLAEFFATRPLFLNGVREIFS